MKINKQLFNFVINRPSLLKLGLNLSNFNKFPRFQIKWNKFLAKSIEGVYSAGETLASAEIRVEELENRNIGVILNYAMEAGKKGN